MATDRFASDAVFEGNVVFGAGVNIPVGAGVAAGAMDHQHRIHYGATGTAATATVPIFECRGATGTIRQIRAGSIVANIGAATVTIDLKKNGTTVLSGVITLDSGNTARISEGGTLSVTSLVVGDLLEIVVTATAGGGTLATGLWVDVTVDEDYAS